MKMGQFLLLAQLRIPLEIVLRLSLALVVNKKTTFACPLAYYWIYPF